MRVWPLCMPAVSTCVHRLLCLGPAWRSVAGIPSDQDLLWYLMAVCAACLPRHGREEDELHPMQGKQYTPWRTS